MSDPVFYSGGYVDGDDSRRRVPTVHVGVDGGPAKGWGHPFFDRLNRILDAAGFDAFVEGLCAPFHRVADGGLTEPAVVPALGAARVAA